jgi:hypothetical protein
MNLTYRQLILLTTAITVFYDEVAKTSTPELKQELMELGEIIQENAMMRKRAGCIRYLLRTFSR